jgi:hypothetical protein
LIALQFDRLEVIVSIRILLNLKLSSLVGLIFFVGLVEVVIHFVVVGVI